MRDFVHLHVHTAYSLLDGLNFIPKLAKTAKEMGFRALAITDHGKMSGVLEFYRECRKAGIKPIIGVEAYLAHETAQEPVSPKNPTDHLLLLVQDETGYRNLCQMLTIAEKPPYFSYRPRVDLELLERFNEGLICSSACISGPIGRHIVEPNIYDRVKREYVGWTQDVQAAIRYAGRLKEIFSGRFFLEVMNHTTSKEDWRAMDPECRESYDEAMKMEKALLGQSRAIAIAAGVPWVATNDCHYLSKMQHVAHDVLMQINTKRGAKVARGSKVLRSGLNQLYLKDKGEMNALFGDKPELLDNTILIAEMCNLEFSDTSFKIPKVTVSPAEQTVYSVITTEQLMRSKAFEGAIVRYGDPIPKEVRDRINFECDTIENIGVCDYMLIVADFMKFARDQGIFVGPARGSAGGSVVSYCIGITDLDPIRHGLLFERFMNPDRVSMPDIDCDFPPGRIQEVLDYVRDKYGADKTARIATFQSLEAKAAIQRVGLDVYGETKDEIFKLTTGMPEKQGNFGVSLGELRKTHAPLVEFEQKNPPKRTPMLDVCEIVVGVKQAASAHAAGVVISDKPLWHYLPLMVGSSERKAKNFDAMMHTQMPMDDLEDLGLLKMDFLAVDYLGTIETCLRYIKDRGGNFEFPPEWEEPYDDAAVYDMLQKGRTAGVFQLESDGMRRITMKVHPEDFEQIYVILAIHRPGPMDSIDPKTGLTMEENFVLRKRGWQDVTYLMPEIKAILKPTYGILVYQEQIIQIAQKVCGLTGAQADVLRKGVGKKKPEIIAKEKKRFIPSAIKLGHDRSVIEKLWHEIETFARYGFNKSHSVGYGKITYQTAYLKAHYLLEWMAALLTIKAENDKQVRKYVDECSRLGIEVLPPDVRYSKASWLPIGNSIRYGLKSIVGISGAADKLVELVGEKPFESFLDFVDRCHAKRIKQSEVDTLIRAGACDHWGKRIAMMTKNKDRWKVLDKRKKKTKETYALFADRIEGLGEGPDMDDDDRQDEHLKLLSGCYVVEIAQTGPSPMRLIVNVPGKDVGVQVIELAQRTRGTIPLIVGIPTEGGGVMWVDVGKVPASNEFRSELEDLGCSLRN